MELIRGELFPKLATKVLIYYDQLYCNPLSIADGDIIYCDTHQINKFKDILKYKKNLIIITHNSDGYVCDSAPWKEHGININDFNECYIKWYSQNSYSKKNNVVPIPIGFENTKWENVFGPKTLWLNEIALEEINPINMVYFNCNEKTNTLERKNCKDICTKFNFVTINIPNLSYKEYLQQIKLHKFTISPEGNGLDCHRTWEILAMKRVPIIKKSGSLERLYKNLPVLLVNDWKDLKNLDLNTEYDNCMKRYNIEFLTMKYWENICKN